MAAPTDAELTDAFTAATRDAVTALFAEYPDHHFYWLSLILTDPSLPPALMAMSEEFLADLRAGSSTGGYDKWDYSWSPVHGYGWDDHYAEVRRLLDLRGDLQQLGILSVSGPPEGVPPAEAAAADAAWEAEYRARMDAMETSMARLDAEGLFGSGERRAGLVVGVEVMPPDQENTARVRRLNPPGALREWLAEAAE